MQSMESTLALQLRADIPKTISYPTKSTDVPQKYFKKVNQKHLICYRYYLLRNSGYLPTNTDYPDKEWFHLIINYHGPSGGMCVYHGNENKRCSSGEYTGTYSTGNGHVVLGRYFTDRDDAQYYASGSVDELMFFNAKLSDSDIEALVNLYK